jgi:hypothetical protein
LKKDKLMKPSIKAILAYSAGQVKLSLEAAGYPLRAALEAGYPLSAAGYSADELEALVPLVREPYTRMLANIDQHKQSTFGPEKMVAEDHLCKTQMCTAGNLVAMGEQAGWALRKKYGWIAAATLIHYKAHPDYPLQNFSAIPQEFAVAYIRDMAAREAAEKLQDQSLPSA